MQTKSRQTIVRGAFSNYFFQHTARVGFATRRHARHAFSVKSRVSGPQERTLYYNPTALKRIDRVIALVPWAEEKMKRNFRYISEHELTHLGLSGHRAYPAAKIRKIERRRREKLVEYWKRKNPGVAISASFVNPQKKYSRLTERVAWSGVLDKIYRELNVAGPKGKKTQEKLCDIIAWLLIGREIESGVFENQMTNKTKKEDVFADAVEVLLELPLLFPKIPHALNNRIVYAYADTYWRLIKEARAALESKAKPIII